MKMTLMLLHGTHNSPFELRRIHPIVVRGRRWLAVLRLGPWSLILAERVKS